MDLATLIAAVPNLSASTATAWLQPLVGTWAEFGISTKADQAAFLAQTGHESNSFATLAESLNYAPTGLHATFPSRVSVEQAQKVARRPGEKTVPVERQVMIGDLVYGGRMGNDRPGDGYRYRGRGAIAITGKDNYRACGAALGLDLVNAPDLLQTLPGAARSAGWFWKTHGCSGISDFVKLTEVINGGLNGLADRTERWKRARAALGV